MPLYEYMCESCGKESELLQRYEDPSPVCKQCDEEMKKRVSFTSFRLAGPNWARDNYGLKDNQ